MLRDCACLQTKRRLENATGCRVEVNTDNVEIHGTDEQRDLCKLCISMTLQQREGKMTIDFKDLEMREDCETTDVPKECVGFVLGAKGATLRQFEEKSRAYMVFDNDTPHEGAEGKVVSSQAISQFRVSSRPCLTCLSRVARKL